jgi:hypothetical protein
MKADLECCQMCTRRMRFGNCAIRAPQLSVDRSGAWCYSRRAPDLRVENPDGTRKPTAGWERP